MFAYGMEGVTNPSSQLYVVNNTFVNDRGSGTAVAVGGQVTAKARVQNNISTGNSAFVGQTGATLVTNCVVADPRFVNRAGFDHRLQAGSPCVDVGSTPGSGTGQPLAATQQYVYDLGHVTRPLSGAAIDAGAFER
jgi:hypothetical protein